MILRNKPASVSPNTLISAATIMAVYLGIGIGVGSLCEVFDGGIPGLINHFFSVLANCKASNDWEGLFLVIFLFVIFPIGGFGFFFFELRKFLKGMEDFNRGLHLKTIELTPSRVFFKFTRPEKDFVCTYERIEKARMIIKTQLVRTKNGSYVGVAAVGLKFKMSDGKEYVCTHIPFCRAMKVIYQVLDYAKYFPQFSYTFSGYGESHNITEKIDFYRQTGIDAPYSTKDMLPTQMMSLLLFGLGIFSMYSFREHLFNIPFTWSMPALFMIITLYIDINLLRLEKAMKKRGMI